MNIKEKIAARAAMEIKEGSIVNLGIGIPTLVADFLPSNKEVFLHSENGLLGVGPTPDEGEVDPEIINAGKLPVTAQIGSSYFSSSESFGMIRGGHVDIAILGALQVAENGDIANWAVPGKDILGVGGAMDLVAGAKEVIVTTQHCAKNGDPKIVRSCDYPITAKNVVKTIITEYAVFRFIDGKMILEEIAEDITLEKLKEITPAEYTVAPNLSKYRVNESKGEVLHGA
ncbi:3-oxoacid CoA-transferase/3-oxoacid CoA-transferase subunit B [Bacillus oleivorans]|uniref:3-oxoacid CoA-transferase/3-oxoacid CoA-transferase subunit B n=1 Tax=Bacillus oleivorans TaxID=1448271 RepID=A0A285CUZ4_9BACI|nr:3-oxoacid CoA-transferase subunit B [Bacillus oleivorans]SNX70753.1 3-oxoacid CoA-transferase/3-oxoacid CoA-transferase subunit B [Bacillus oleivorans]